jgi:hypothetical protein
MFLSIMDSATLVELTIVISHIRSVHRIILWRQAPPKFSLRMEDRTAGTPEAFPTIRPRILAWNMKQVRRSGRHLRIHAPNLGTARKSGHPLLIPRVRTWTPASSNSATKACGGIMETI